MHDRKTLLLEEKGFEIKPHKMIMARMAIYIFSIYIYIYICVQHLGTGLAASVPVCRPTGVEGTTRGSTSLQD